MTIFRAMLGAIVMALFVSSAWADNTPGAKTYTDPCPGVACQARIDVWNQVGGCSQSTSGSDMSTINNSGTSVPGWNNVDTVGPWECHNYKYSATPEPTWTVWQTWTPVNVCASTLNQPITGTLSRSTSTPPQEVCQDSCTYELDVAEPRTQLDGSPIWYGTWRGSGQACTGGSAPNPSGDPATPSTGDVVSAEVDAKETELSDKLAALLANSAAQRQGADPGKGPSGSFFSLPSWVTSILTPQRGQCALGLAVPGTFEASSMLNAALSSSDACTLHDIADTYGNWFVWFCAVLWTWVIVVGGRGD